MTVMTRTTEAGSTPAPAPGRAPRELLQITTRLSDDGYDRIRVEGREPTTSIADATLVNSRTTRGTHAPGWDLDFPAVLTRAGDGALTLWVDGNLRDRRVRRLLKLGSELGVFTAEPGRAKRRDDRQRAYAQASAATLDTAARNDVLREAGCSLASTLEGCLAAAAGIAYGPDGRPGLVQGPSLSDPWPIPLRVPGELVPSTSNSHLYLDVELRWPEYKKLLVAARRAGLLERGYVGASIAREGTHLRLPWLRKTKPRRQTAPF